MSNKLLVIGIVLVFVVLLPLLFESMYNYTTFVAPIKNSHLDVQADHYDAIPVSSPNALFIHNINLISDDTIEIEFGENKYNLKNPGYYEQVPKFSFTTVIKEGQTFLERCSTKYDPDKPGIGIYKYVGLAIDKRDGEKEPVFLFYHVSSTVQSPMPCKFPQIIENSIDVIQLDAKPNSNYHFIENLSFEWDDEKSEVKEEKSNVNENPGLINPEKNIPTFFAVMLMEQNIEWEMPQREWNNPDFELESPARVCSQIINSDKKDVYLSTVLLNPYELSDMIFHDSLPDDCMKVLPVTQFGRK